MIDFRLILHKNKPNALNEYPIYLRLYQNGIAKLIPTKVRVKENEWNADKQKVKNRADGVALNYQLSEFLNSKSSKYNNLNIDKREAITIEDYLDLLNQQTVKNKSENLYTFLDGEIRNLEAIGKIGTAKCRHETKNSMLRFDSNKNLKFEQITVNWLTEYEQNLRERGCKDGSISVRMRTLRAVYNSAVKLGITSNINLPFDKYKISKLKVETNPRGIPKEDIEAIQNLDTIEYPKLKFTKDLFLFSYYVGGMNFIDLTLLTNNQIVKNERIRYFRTKSKSFIELKIHNSAKPIMEYYQAHNIGTQYIFPILLSDQLAPKQKYNRLLKMRAKFNRDLKEIGRICSIELDLSSYVSRHSFAGNLKSSKVSSDEISELMGHKDIKVTQAYLKRLSNDVLDSAMDKL